MRKQGESGTARRARTGSARRAGLRLPAALALALILASILAASAGALPTRDACSAPREPGHARCLAMRLLVGSAAAAAQPMTATRAGRTAQPDNKPAAGFQTPQRLRELYALPEETAAGSTQTIALVDAFDDPTAEADLAVYSKQFGLPACTSENGCFKKVNQNGEASPLPAVNGGWASEISIDVQMAHSICQTCHILLVEAKTEEFSDLGAGVDAAVSLGAGEISNSYGSTEETGLKELEEHSYNHPGVVLTVSSGDCAYLNRACPEELAEGTEFPADSPHVIAVGGTSVHESGGVWTSTAWKEGGSGCSTLFSAPLWQSGVAGFAATGCGTGRAVADVSAVGDPNTGVDIYDSTPEFAGGPTGWGVWGGTSVASPIVAAEFALAGGSHGVSYPAATLYGHAGEASALYDVVSGGNGECGTATICKATTGYDGPTGIGSPIGLGAFGVSGTPKSTGAPTISGYAEVGQPLTVHQGGWTGSPTSFTHQWERCGFEGKNCQQIATATGTSYTPVTEDIGHQIRVREAAFNESGSGYEDSATVGPVASDVPTVSGFSPTSGFTGSTILVNGTALDSTTSVQLGTLPAAFTVISPAQIEVTVPNGAKKAKLTVTTAHGSATPKTKFTPTFGIASFAPLSAATGARVTIKGEGFTPSSSVQFDGVPAASVTYMSAKKLRVLVPAGAGTGPITVSNESPAGTVSSAASFTP
jgi:hypothetical protein